VEVRRNPGEKEGKKYLQEDTRKCREICDDRSRTRSMGDLGRSGRHTGRSEGNTGSSEIGDAGRIIREMERRFQEEI
jgi:hypothetical protein